MAEPMRTSVSKFGIILANVGGDDRDALQTILEGTGWEIVESEPAEIEGAFREAAAPIVFFNQDRSDSWRKKIRILMKMRRNACVILLAGENDASLGEEVAQWGAFDVLTRPLRREQVLPMLLFAYSYCRGYGQYSSRSRCSRSLS
jgi:AmiR/NasT family two-component response regulator